MANGEWFFIKARNRKAARWSAVIGIRKGRQLTAL